MENQGKSDVQLEWLHEVEDYVERATEREAQDVSPKQSIGNFLNARFIPIGTALHFKLVWSSSLDKVYNEYTIFSCFLLHS